MKETAFFEIEEIESALRVLLVPAVPGEYDLHALISAALENAGINAQHEVSIGPRARIDFLAGNVGIEVKKGKPDKKALLNQLSRYLESDRLSSILVVSQKNVLLPKRIGAKEIRLLSLDKLWGVSLP